MDEKTMRCRIHAYDFSILELGLFLDTHCEDAQALEKRQELQDQRGSPGRGIRAPVRPLYRHQQSGKRRPVGMGMQSVALGLLQGGLTHVGI